MKLIIKNDDYEACLIDDEGRKQEIDLRYYPFEMEKNKIIISIFAEIYDTLKNSKYSNFESCMGGLLVIGGIPKFIIESTTISYGGWTNTNWYKLKRKEEINKIIKEIKKFISTKEYFGQTFIYECNNEIDILIATIFHFLKTKGKIKKCKNCNKWFMTLSRSDTEYCDRKTKNKITCKELNIIKAKKKYREDPVIKLKESIATYYLNNHNYLYYEFLDKFNDKNRMYRDGEITREEIMQWLENNRAPKVIRRGWFEYGKTNIDKKE